MNNSRKIGPIAIRQQMVQHKTTGKWFVDIPSTLTRTGKRKRKLYGSKTQAEKVAREVNKRFKMRDLDAHPVKQITRMTLNQAITGWVTTQELLVQAKHLRGSSLRSRKHQLVQVAIILGKYQVASVTKERILEYQAKRICAGLSPVTVNCEVAALKQVLVWLQEEGKLSTVPKVKRVPEHKRDLNIPTQQEVLQMIQYLPDHYQVLVRLMAWAGLRPGEAYNLPWAHVNLADGYILIRSYGDWMPKTYDSDRMVWLSDDLSQELLNLKREGEYVFAGRKEGKALTTFKRSLKEAVDKAAIMRNDKLVPITPKTFRKAFATWQAERNISEPVLQKQMGHAKGSRMTAQYYIHVQENEVRKACLEMPKIENNLAIPGNGQEMGGAE